MKKRTDWRLSHFCGPAALAAQRSAVVLLAVVLALAAVLILLAVLVLSVVLILLIVLVLLAILILPVALILLIVLVLAVALVLLIVLVLAVAIVEIHFIGLLIMPDISGSEDSLGKIRPKYSRNYLIQEAVLCF